MTVATKPRPATVASPLGLNVQLLELERELNTVFLARRDPIRTLLTCLLAAEHAFILGPPGTAKSELLEAICRAFIDAKYFRVLMDRQMGKEEIAGAIDVPDYVATGHWGRNTTDTIADAHIAFLDEVGNTGPLVMNMLLTAMQERMNKPNGQWVSIPLISLFGASNYWLEDMPAVWDRFPVRFEVGYLVEDADFDALYERACLPETRPRITTQIALQALQSAIAKDVPAVIVPPGVRDAIRQLRSDLRGESIIVSDRRWAKTAKLIKASAFLNGRSTADEDDLQILKHVLWEQPSDQLTVARKVLGLQSEVARAAADMGSMLDSILAEVDARRGMKITERAAHGGTAQFELNQVQERLTATLEKANREGRSTDALEALGRQIRQVRTQVYITCMNIDADRAASLP